MGSIKHIVETKGNATVLGIEGSPSERDWQFLALKADQPQKRTRGSVLLDLTRAKLPSPHPRASKSFLPQNEPLAAFQSILASRSSILVFLCKPEDKVTLQLLLGCTPLDSYIYDDPVSAYNYLEAACRSRTLRPSLVVRLPDRLHGALFDSSVNVPVEQSLPYTEWKFDFSRTKSVGYQEIVELYLVCQYLAGPRHSRISFDGFRNAKVRESLRRTRFFDLFRGSSKDVEFNLDDEVLAHPSPKSGIVGIYPIVTNQQVEDLSRTGYFAIRTLIANSHPGVETRFINSILEILLELINNALQHSRTLGCLLIRSVPGELFQFVIADRGVGLRLGVLKNYADVVNPTVTDLEAIEIAFDSRLRPSARDQTQRGRGLPSVKARLADINGSLAVRTGDASVIISGTKSPTYRKGQLSRVLGTIYDFRIQGT